MQEDVEQEARSTHTQSVHVMSFFLPRDGSIVGLGDDFLGAVENNRIGDVKALNLPRVAVGEPGVGELNLVGRA